MISDKKLLIHWWNRFDRGEYMRSEFEKFKEILDEYGEEKIWGVVVSSYLFSDGSAGTMLYAIRTNCVGELVEESWVEQDLNEEVLNSYNSLKEEIKKLLIGTYAE